MSDTFNIGDLLDKPMSDFPDRPNLPGAKHFYGKITNFATTFSKVKKTPGYHVTVRLTDPGEDVTKAELDAIAAAGFNIGDYEAGADFWLTPNSGTFLRRFVASLGFPEGTSFRENLSLDGDYNPTPETIEKLRGLDVIVKTPAPNENGVVFIQNVETIAGVKRS